METANKIQVQQCTISPNGNWANLKTTDGKEISVMLTKALKVKAQIDAALTHNSFPFSVECKMVVKGDKTYAWDFEERKSGGGGKGFAPKDEGAIIAQSSFASACQFYQQRAGTPDDVLILAEKGVSFVKKHSTLKPQA